MHMGLIYLIAQCMVMDNLKMSDGYGGAPPPHVNTNIKQRMQRQSKNTSDKWGWGVEAHTR